MRYLFAILLPPVAVLFSGRPIQAMLNLILTLCFWIPGALHACFVVHQDQEDRRAQRIVDALARTRRA